jgi:hypothetical protein
MLRCLAVAAIALVPAVAHAHFELVSPANWANQDQYGAPEKTAPCGQADPDDPPVLTNAVTGLVVGSTITITIDEKVFHPGHYRVALASDMASLPADPVVTPDSTSACGTAAIETTPVLPVLADNQLVHTTAFSSPQSMQVALPAGMLCDHCTLQIVEFMSDHGAPCFYHHCANVAISTTGADAGAGANPDAGAGGSSSSGGCDLGGARSNPCVLLVALTWLVVRRRRPAGAQLKKK